MFPAEWARPKDLVDYQYDPEKAKALLAEAGWDTTRQVDLQRYYTDQVNKDTVDAIASMLQEVGINAVVREVKSAEFQASVDDGSLELAYAANGQGLDPSLGFLVTGCEQRLAVGYCNKTVDELYATGQSSPDRAVRGPAYQEISKILNAELPKVWLWWEVRPVAFDTRIVGLAEHYAQQPLLMFDVPVYNEMHLWYTK
jgi:peptide/nickel transport system substrate-binding protein